MNIAIVFTDADNEINDNPVIYMEKTCLRTCHLLAAINFIREFVYIPFPVIGQKPDVAPSYPNMSSILPGFMFRILGDIMDKMNLCPYPIFRSLRFGTNTDESPRFTYHIKIKREEWLLLQHSETGMLMQSVHLDIIANGIVNRDDKELEAILEQQKLEIEHPRSQAYYDTLSFLCKLYDLKIPAETMEPDVKFNA